jgi:hypothetical protein
LFGSPGGKPIGESVDNAVSVCNVFCLRIVGSKSIRCGFTVPEEDTVVLIEEVRDAIYNLALHFFLLDIEKGMTSIF